MDQERLIICNTSPSINLAEIDLLEVLEALPGQVCIPPGVRDEAMAKSGLFAKPASVADSGRFRVLPPTNDLLVRSFSATQHRGESECLAVSMEHPGSILILDDLAARAAASANGLSFTGPLGLLAAAKARGQIIALAHALHQLRIRARFWINSQLERELLQQTGEAQ
jgi:predicted nucleic acid-binding protein